MTPEPIPIRKPGHFHFLVPDWAPGPIQMCRDRRDIPGCAVKVGFGRVFAKKVAFRQIQVSKRYLSFFRAFGSSISLQERFHEIRSVFVILYKVLKPDLCFPITPKS